MQRVPWRDRDRQRGDLLRPVRPGAPDLRILCLPTQALGRPPQGTGLGAHRSLSPDSFRPAPHWAAPGRVMEREGAEAPCLSPAVFRAHKGAWRLAGFQDLWADEKTHLALSLCQTPPSHHHV